MKSTFRTALCLFAATLLFAGCGAKADWQKYDAEDAGFSVLMPSKDVEVESNTASTVAGNIEIYMYSVSLSKAYYMIAYNQMDFLEDAELTDSDMNDILEGGVEGALNTFPDGEFIYKRNTTLSGHPGIEYRAEGTKNETEMVIFGKVYLVGTRLYQVMVTTVKGDANNPDIAKFMDSFKLI